MTIAVPVSLAHRQHAAGRDVGVLQELQRHVLVVSRRLAVVEDVAQLLEMAGAQQVGDVVECRSRQQGERLRIDCQHVLAVELGGADMVGRELAVGRGVRSRREHLWNWELGHGFSWRGNQRDGRPKTAKSAARLLLSKAVELDDLGGRILGLVRWIGGRFGLGRALSRRAERGPFFRRRQGRRRLVGARLDLLAAGGLVLAVELQGQTAPRDRRRPTGR